MSIEDKLRDSFLRQAAHVEPGPSSRDSIARRLERSKKRRPAARLSAAALALAVSAGALVWLWNAFGLDSTRTNTTSPAAAIREAKVSATFELPSGGRAIAGGDGAGWASLHDRLVRIDAATGEIKTIPLDPGPYGIAVIGDSVWATGYSKDEGSYLKRLDSATGSVVATIRFPGSAFSLDFSLLAGDGSSVWVGVSEPTGLHLVKIDTQTNTRVAEVSVGEPPKGEERQIIDLISGGGSIWALVRDLPIEGERVDNTYLVQVNQDMARIDSTMDIPNAGSIVYVDGKIWASLGDAALLIDPTTGATSKVAIPGGFFLPSATNDGIWFVESSQADGGSAALAHLDTITQQVDITVPLSIDPSSPDRLPEDASLDPQTDTGWVLNADGTVFQVDMQT